MSTYGDKPRFLFEQRHAALEEIADARAEAEFDLDYKRIHAEFEGPEHLWGTRFEGSDLYHDYSKLNRAEKMELIQSRRERELAEEIQRSKAR